MNAVRLLPVILSLLVFGAHFLRDGNTVVTALCIAIIILLFLRERWVPRVIQAVLLLATIEWLHTLYGLIGERTVSGRSWTVAAIILGSVATISALSALVFRTKGLKRFYKVDPNLLED